MSWRTVIISSRCKLDLKLGYMVVRGETVQRIFLDEIAMVIIENPAVSMTGCLLSELIARKIKVIFCDGKRSPQAELVEVVDHCLNFQLNTKSLLGKIQTALERTAVNDLFFLKTTELLQSVEQYMDELAFTYDCDLVYQRCTAAGLIKAMSVHIRDAYDDPLERLLDYMELVREFDRDKLFVLLHLRSYFAEEQTGLFLKTVAEHGYRVLLVDSQDYEKLPEENRITIDKDLCEF